jgi:hypothetical protein
MGRVRGPTQPIAPYRPIRHSAELNIREDDSLATHLTVKLTARGDPDHDHVVAGVVARLIELPRRAVVLAEDETHLNLLPHVRASWTLRTVRPQIPTPARTGRSPSTARSR